MCKQYRGRRQSLAIRNNGSGAPPSMSPKGGAVDVFSSPRGQAADPYPTNIIFLLLSFHILVSIKKPSAWYNQLL